MINFHIPWTLFSQNPFFPDILSKFDIFLWFLAREHRPLGLTFFFFFFSKHLVKCRYFSMIFDTFSSGTFPISFLMNLDVPLPFSSLSPYPLALYWVSSRENMDIFQSFLTSKVLKPFYVQFLYPLKPFPPYPYLP